MKNLILTLIFVLYGILVKAESETESNNSYLTANAVIFGTAYTGSLTSGDEDWFKISLPFDGKIECVLTPSGTLNSNIEMYDTNGTNFIRGCNPCGGEGEADFLTYGNLMAGNYYLRVIRNNSVEDSYSFTVTYTQTSLYDQNDLENNDVYSSALTIDATGNKSGHLGYYQMGYTDSWDFYSVTLPYDGKLLVYTDPESILNTNILLWDTDGTSYIQGVFYQGSAGQSDSLRRGNLKAGTYFMRIDKDGGDVWGSYTVNTVFSPTSIPEGDDVEPNDTYSDAISMTLNSSKTGHIGYYGTGNTDNADWYSVTLNKDGRIKFWTTPESSLNTGLALFDNDGSSYMTGCFSCMAAGVSDSLVNNNLMAGTYFLRIEHYGTFGSYTLNNSFEATSIPDGNDAGDIDGTTNNGYPSTAIDLTLNTTTTGHLGYHKLGFNDDADWYKIVTMDIGHLVVSVEPDQTLNTEVGLFASNGSDYLRGCSVCSGTGINDTLKYLDMSAGTYYIRLERSGTYGSYTLKASFLGLNTVIADFSADYTLLEEGGTVTFTDHSTASPTSWAWDFGDGQTSTVQNPQHIYSTAGTYTVSMTATNAYTSDTKTRSNYITVVVPVTAVFSADVTSGVAPLSVQFTDASIGSPSSWLWNFGDGGSSAIQNPSHTYNSAGTYTVSLSVSKTGSSNDEIKTDYIIITGPPPVAAFTADATSGTAPLTVQFTDQSTNSPTSWSWNFGYGQTVTTQNPSHVFTAAGTYTVSLTVTNAGGSDEEIKTDYITVIVPAPVAAFTADATSGTAPMTVQFTDQSTNSPTSWSWNFGDGGTSTSQNPNHTYIAAGTYTVSLTATNAGGSDSEIKTDYITVANPVVTDIWTYQSSGNTNWLQSVFFLDDAHGWVAGWSNTLLYTVDGGTTWTAATSGVSQSLYDVCFVSPTTGWAVGSSGLIIKSEDGGKNWTTQNSNTTAALFSVCFTDATTGYAAGEFGKRFKTVDGGENWTEQSQGENNIFDIYFKDGIGYQVGYMKFYKSTDGGNTWTTTYTFNVDEYIYSVEFLDANDGFAGGENFSADPDQGFVYKTTDGGASWTKIVIAAKPVRDVTFATNNVGYACGGSVTTTGQIWTTTDAGVAWTEMSYTPSAPSGTIYSVYFSSLNRGFAAGYDGNILTIETTISQPPLAVFTADVTSGTAPLTVQFTDQSTNSPTSWLWNFGDGHTATTQNPSHVFTAAGTYTVSLTATNAGGSDEEVKTDYITVIVPAPVAAFTADATSGTAPMTVQFTDQSTNSPTSWSWNFGDGQTATTQNPSHVFATAGTYTVSLTATNDGGSDEEIKTDYITVTVPAPVAAFTADVTSGTAPLTVQFTDQSTNSPVSWLWNFGDGQTATSQNPSHVFATAGTYTVSLTATNAGGSDEEIKTDYITVTVLAPVAAFTADATSGTAPMTVQFTDQSTNSPTSWSWDFGDGQTATTQNPSHVFATAGTYTVSLTATNAGGSDEEIKTDYITVTIPAPVAAFTADVTSGTAPLTVQFTDQSANSPSSWSWNFGDGGTSTSQNPNHTYTAAGTYTVSLTATNAGGSDEEVKVDYITVAGEQTVYTLPFAQGFENAVFPPADWEKYRGENGLGVNEDWQRITTLESYELTSCAKSRYENVTDGMLAEDWLVTPKIQLAAANNLLTFYEKTESPVNYGSQFYIKISTSGQTTHSGFTNLESYTETIVSNVWTLHTINLDNYAGQQVFIAFVHANDFGDSWFIDAIQINGQSVVAPVAAFTADATSGTAPLTVQFTDQSANSPTSWSWNFGDGQTATTQNPSHVFATAGTYTVSLTATNAGGSDEEIKTDYITVTIPAPVAAFTADVTSGTAPLTVQFTDQSANSPTSWSWNFGDGSTSTSQNPNHTYTAAGTYTVSLTATNAGGSDEEIKTDYITVTVPAPVAAFTADATSGTAPLTVQFTDQSANSPSSWSWNFGDGGTSTSQNPNHTYTAAGTYTVSLTATNAGGSDEEVKVDYITVAGEQTVYTLPFAQGFENEVFPPADWVKYRGENGLGVNEDWQRVTTSESYELTSCAKSRYENVTDGMLAEDWLVTPKIQLAAANNQLTFYEKTESPVNYGSQFYIKISTQSQSAYAGFSNLEAYTESFVSNVWTEHMIDLDAFSGQQVYIAFVHANDFGDAWNIDAIQVNGNAVSAPVAAFTADVTSGTATLTVQFTDQSTNSPTSWSWNFGDGQTATTQNPSHVFATAGTYTVSLTATNAGGSDEEIKTDYITVTVPAPVAAFTADVTSGTAPLTVQFTDQSTNSPTSWSWNFGDGQTATTQNPSHVFATAGTYTVSLTATNAGGSDEEIKTDYITVTVPAPVAAFTADVTSGTAPMTVQFTDQSTNSPTSRSWNFGDGQTATTQNPSHVFAAAGTYTVSLTATNAGGSDEEIKTDYITVNAMVVIPALSTSPVLVTSETSLIGGGNITSDGGSLVSARGICWSITQNPVVSGNHTTDGTGAGSFSSTVDGLTPNSVYYIRAYATNSAGTAYGEQFMVKTWEGHVTDVNSNNYPTIVLGGQTWMASDLKASSYNNGDPIATGLSNSEWQNTTSGAYCEYNNDQNMLAEYGRLYNWFAVTDERGLCPDGWHTPTDMDWKTLEQYLGMSADDVELTGYRGTNEGGKLKETGTSHWNSPNTEATNVSGFTALPGGNRDYFGAYQYLGNWAYYWTSDESPTYYANAISRSLAFNDARIARYNISGKQSGFSVRCVKNQQSTQEYAALPFSENFDNNWVDKNDTRDVPSVFWENSPSTGSNSWSRNDDGIIRGAWNNLSGAYSPSGANGSSNSARFHSYEAGVGLTGKLDVHVNLEQSGNKVLKFWYINISGTDQLNVSLSIDAGQTFGNNLISLIAMEEWTEYIVQLGTPVSGQCIIQFEAISDWGYTDIGIDQISIDYGNSVSDVTNSDIRVSPNPFGSILKIESEKTWSKAELIDPFGKVVFSFDRRGVQTAQLETSQLSQGMYLLHLNFDDGSKIVKKIIHQ